MWQGYHGGSAYMTELPWWFYLYDRSTIVVLLMRHGYMVVLPIQHWYHRGSTYGTVVPWWSSLCNRGKWWFYLCDRDTMVVLLMRQGYFLWVLASLHYRWCNIHFCHSYWLCSWQHEQTAGHKIAVTRKGGIHLCFLNTHTHTEHSTERHNEEGKETNEKANNCISPFICPQVSYTLSVQNP